MSGHLLCRYFILGKVVNRMKIGAFPKEAFPDSAAVWYPAAFQAKPLPLSSFHKGSTALVIVDMVNGFTLEGALSSPNSASLLPAIAQLMYTCKEQEFPMVFFADTHLPHSPEFSSYPVHCLAGSSEARPAEILEEIGGYALFPKNSTNGFLEPAFQSWLTENPQITNFIVVGCCTDICVQQFSLSLKTDFNRRNVASRVTVPMALTATYDAPGHPAAMTEAASYQNMQTSGVEIVSDILFT